MAFDRKQYGMNSGIPFIKIADRVEVSVNLKAKRVSGPPLALKHQVRWLRGFRRTSFAGRMVTSTNTVTPDIAPGHLG
jgi:hypothetical protein